MIKISVRPQWQAWKVQQDQSRQAVDATALLRILAHIQALGSIAAAGRAVGMSYRHVWGLLREAEDLFGAALLDKQPGRGTQLSELALALLHADERIAARLSPTLDSLASELETEIRKAMASSQAPLRLFASHGFAVATLLEWMQAANLPVEVRYRNSTEALAALAKDECDLAGFHVPLGEFEKESIARYLVWLDPDQHLLLHLATRRQGLFVAPGNPAKIAGLQDLHRKGVRFVNRQSGSGTRMLLEMLLAKHQISPSAIAGYETAEFTHAAVAAYIASHMADVGFGVETAARRFGLDFVPLAEERYFFAIKREGLDLPAVTSAVDMLRSPGFLAALAKLKGYDASETGSLQSVRDAFPHLRRKLKQTPALTAPQVRLDQR